MQQCKRWNGPRLGIVAAAVMTLAYAGHAGAFEIDTGSDDVKIRLDNKVSATLGWRTRDADASALRGSNPALTSEVFASRGDLYTTRFDLYSEFDVKFQKDHGIRLSAAAWYDPSFPSAPPSTSNDLRSAGLSNYSSFGPGAGEWSGNTKRFYKAGAELLDAFAFTRVELGEVPVSVKLGRTSVVWGEAMFGQAGGISSVGYAQNPNDGRKGSQNPNSSLKETSLPIGQIHLVANITDTSNLSVYKAFEWRPDRVPAGGTYMGFADFVEAPNLFCAPTDPTATPPNFAPFCVPNANPVNGRRGDWGVQYKFRPSFYSGNIAAIYREFSEKAPWYAVWDTGTARSVYGNKTRLVGVTTNTTAYDISWGGEFNYRQNAALASTFGANPFASFDSGARGNTVHAVGNMQAFLGKALFWDTFVVAAEVAYARLRNITQNQALFDTSKDKSGTVAALYLDPTVYQVIPGVDLEIPVFVQRGFGDSPLNGGSAHTSTTVSAGFKGTWNTAVGPQVFQLNYLAFRGQTRNFVAATPYATRDQIQLSYTSSF